MPTDPKVCPIRMHAIESQSLEIEFRIDLEKFAPCIENQCAAWDVRFHRCDLMTGIDRTLQQIPDALRRIARRL